MNCTKYEITSNNYDSIKELIPKADEVDLYDEIKNNPDFLCYFKVNEGNEHCEGIEIIDLNNADPEIGNNIFPMIFCEINDIKRLVLSELKLFKLPNQFENFKKLEELYLSDNKFKEIPQVLFLLPKLRVLYLNDNEFDIIPSDITKMNNLETLNIQGCYSLISISSNLFKLKNLKELDLSLNCLLFKNNDFVSCSFYSDNETSTENESNDYTDFVSYEFLKKIYISDNELSTFPGIFSNFINLEQLDISNNLFEEIPYEIHSFTNLEVLNISYNRIKKIIIENGMFNNLLRLYLQYNEITELSTSVNALQNLETFDLSNNNFSKLDRNIFQLKRLKNVSVFGNTFTEIEEFSCTRDDPISFTLTLKNISVLPNIFCCNGIHELLVKCNSRFDNEVNIFEHVPTNSKIKHLDLYKCFLTHIPRGISKLINLEIFSANDNEIIILNNVFTGITSLKSLDLSINQITNIDRSIFDIITLENLNLNFNNIELLPSNINNMSNRNLQISLYGNPLYLGTDVNSPYPELISIE